MNRLPTVGKATNDDNPEPGVSAAGGVRLSYLICATPRTGSNFLCENLQAVGVAGRPDDYFWNPPFWQQQWGVSTLGCHLQE